jgi:hypothetical protein
MRQAFSLASFTAAGLMLAPATHSVRYAQTFSYTIRFASRFVSTSYVLRRQHVSLRQYFALIRACLHLCPTPCAAPGPFDPRHSFRVRHWYLDRVLHCAHVSLIGTCFLQCTVVNAAVSSVDARDPLTPQLVRPDDRLACVKSDQVLRSATLCVANVRASRALGSYLSLSYCMHDPLPKAISASRPPGCLRFIRPPCVLHNPLVKPLAVLSHPRMPTLLVAGFALVTQQHIRRCLRSGSPRLWVVFTLLCCSRQWAFSS